MTKRAPEKQKKEDDVVMKDENHENFEAASEAVENIEELNTKILAEEESISIENLENSENDLQEMIEKANFDNLFDDDQDGSIPLKKRPRMMEFPYATGHAINQQVS